MQWLNEPASWQRVGDELTVTVDPDTDFWRETGYGYVHDNGHVYGEVLPGDLDVTVRIRGNFATQYDQAGIMLRADEQTWLKTGVEFFEGRARLSTVLTLGQSSWSVADLPGWTDEITLRAARRGDAVEIRYAAGDGELELAALVFMPADVEMLAGVMCAAPEGLGFRVTFSELTITDRAWVEVTDEEMTAWADAQEPGEDWPGTDTMTLPAAMEPSAAGEPADMEPLAAGYAAMDLPAAGEPADMEPWAARPADIEPPLAGEPAPPGPAATGYQHAGYAVTGAADDEPPVTGAADDEPRVTGPADDDPPVTADAVAEPRQATGDGEDAEDRDGDGEDGPGPSAEPAPPGGFVASPPRDFGTAGTGPAAATGDAQPQAEDRVTPPAGAGTAAGEAAATPTGDEATRPPAGAPAPGPAADWEQLAARIRARHWAVPDDGNLSDSWPGPPLVVPAAGPAAGEPDTAGASPSDGVPAPADVSVPAQASVDAGVPAGDDDKTEPDLPAARDDAPPATGTPSEGEEPAASQTRAAKGPRRLTFKPRIDLPAPPDPADEWISLLTADPADE
jgi:uncharacterized protein